MEEFLKESFYKQVLNLFQNAKKSVSTAVNMTNILKHLSEKLTKEIGRGFSYDNLKLMRKFYLSWSHYLILMRTSNEDERHFYVIESPEDILKDPYVLEFTGLPELTSYSESELEEKIIDHLQQFLLELGRGFTFVGRQVRFTFEEDHY